MTDQSIDDAIAQRLAAPTSPIEESPLVHDLRVEIRNLRTTIDIIGSELYEEAQNRDWCSEYNDFVKGVNERLPDGMPQLSYLTREFTVSFRVEASNEAALNPLERHIDAWLVDHSYGSCHSYEIEDNS